MKISNAFYEMIIASIIWGTSGVFIKYLNLPITVITFFRCFVPTFILFIYFIIKDIKLFVEDFKLMFIASTLNALRMFLYFVGFTLTTIGNAVILWYTKPIFVVILSIIFFNEKINFKKIFCLFISFLGILFIFANKDFSFLKSDFIGMLAILIASIITSFANIIYKKEVKKFSEIKMIFYQNFVGAIIFIPFVFLNFKSLNLFKTFIASSYAFLIGIVGFVLFFSAIKKMKISNALIIAYLEVISAIIFGFIFFNETLSFNVIIGGILIIFSTFFLEKK